jgi:alpha-L-rhamnosidase
MKRFACFFLSVLLLAVFAFPANAQRSNAIIASTLRCEYLVDPLAIDTREPRLSWVIDSRANGAMQTAYQILVASSAKNLAAGTGDLWDTGKVASNQTNQISYAGKPLASRQRCFWKVRVWHQNDKPAAWSRPSEWSMGLLQTSDWSASWVGDKQPSVENVAATTLRRAFTLPGKARRAIVYASALGVYELHINGQRVGNHVLAPEFTDYHTRTQYQAYDVTALLQAGDNCIGAQLGDGWYAGGVGLAHLIKKTRNIYGNHPRLLAQLEIELANGKTERVVTDGSWRATRDGAIRSADILQGEEYDARRDLYGWDKAGFDDKGWQSADVASDVKTQLVAQPNEPIRVNREIKPVALNQPKPGVYVFDMGQNMVGWCRLKTRGAAGTKVTLRHAEMLNEDGTIYTENLRIAKQADTFILKGSPQSGGIETFEPHFTYHGFRYVEVTGVAEKPGIEALTGRALYSDMTETGSFECSEPMLNKLWQNILWTQRDNMHSMPTDCPQRDERLGWMGDIQIFVGTGILNMDMAAFFTKWMRDVRDAQADDGRFADFSPHPFGRNDRFTGVPGWGDAGIVVPWRMWQHYGDKRILAESFESGKRWVEFIRSNNPDLLWKKKRGNDYGDWLNSDTFIYEGIPRKGGEVPKEVFATMMFAYATDLLGRMASVLGKEEEAKTYRALFADIKAALNKAYVAEDGRIQGNTQAGYALALHFDLLPEKLRPAAVKHMLEGIEAYKGHMSTGFHSTYRMMLELTREGHNEVAYKLINHRGFPSWGYSIENGATTIWERWDGYVKGRGFQNKGMNSFNHYAIGAVGEWMYRVILGINQDDQHAGYEHFIVRPQPGGGLNWAKGSYNSIRGKIEVDWKFVGDMVALNLTVPPNTSATVYLPTPDRKSFGKTSGVEFLRWEGTTAVLKVKAGKYNFLGR